MTVQRSNDIGRELLNFGKSGDESADVKPGRRRKSRSKPFVASATTPGPTITMMLPGDSIRSVASLGVECGIFRIVLARTLLGYDGDDSWAKPPAKLTFNEKAANCFGSLRIHCHARITRLKHHLKAESGSFRSPR